MKSYLIKLNAREEGPYTDAQLAQVFADGRIDRHTPCRPVTGTDWKTIDDYLPMLKYGTQLPAPSASVPASAPDPAAAAPPPIPAGSLPQYRATVSLSNGTRVAVTDINVPFGSVLKMAFKIAGAWFIVGVCCIPIVILLWIVALGGLAAFVTGLLSGGHH